MLESVIIKTRECLRETVSLFFRKKILQNIYYNYNETEISMSQKKLGKN